MGFTPRVWLVFIAILGPVYLAVFPNAGESPPPVAFAVDGIGHELPPCAPLNLSAAREGIVCIPKCAPRADRTIEGRGLDAEERINVTFGERPDKKVTKSYLKYRVHFPEEDVTLSHASEEMMGLHPKPYNERLLRRIVAKLYRAGVMDPKKSIVNTGSFIGDNALPWGMMLQRMTDAPGRVIAVDPSPEYLRYMTGLANENSIGNVCTRLGIYSSEEKTIFADKTEHMEVKEGLSSGKEVRAVTLDSEGIEDLGLLHLDVEGHESEVLEGAIGLIGTNRPVIITEGEKGLNNGYGNDRRVGVILKELGYATSNSDEIPELCGWNPKGRNRIWWPDDNTAAAARAVVGKELNRPGLVPWFAYDLPE